MNNFKGTPAPWTRNSADTVFSEDMVMVCEVNAESYDKRNANAHLISAAPNLLEACQLLLDDPNELVFRLKAQAAINKALNTNP